MIHVFWAEQYGVHLSEARKEEVQLRSTSARLERILELDSRPLVETRPPGRRVVGNCRDFAVMLTAPESFGIFDMHGLWFVRGNLVRDVASLNKVELLPWNCWGIIEGQDETLSEEDFRFLDEVAALTCGDVPEWERVRALYEEDGRLRVPAVITSYTSGGPQSVHLEID